MIRIYDQTGESKASEFSVKVIRPEVVEKCQHTSSMGRGKFFVIEQADLMNASAQNALLKTLEEPEGRTAIVLLSESGFFLFPTIRSRCQTVQFARLDERLIVEELVKRGIVATTAKDAASLSDGSLGGAMRLIDEGTLGLARELCEQIDGLLIRKPPADLAGFLTRAAAAYADKQLEHDPLSSKSTATRTGLSLFLHVAAEKLRRRLHESVGDLERERVCTAIDATRQCQMYLDANVTVAVALGQLAGQWGSGG
jgi:DNA polymerase-3 subunit delta'